MPFPPLCRPASADAALPHALSSPSAAVDTTLLPELADRVHINTAAIANTYDARPTLLRVSLVGALRALPTCASRACACACAGEGGRDGGAAAFIGMCAASLLAIAHAPTPSPTLVPCPLHTDDQISCFLCPPLLPCSQPELGVRSSQAGGAGGKPEEQRRLSHHLPQGHRHLPRLRARVREHAGAQAAAGQASSQGAQVAAAAARSAAGATAAEEPPPASTQPLSQISPQVPATAAAQPAAAAAPAVAAQAAAPALRQAAICAQRVTPRAHPASPFADLP